MHSHYTTNSRRIHSKLFFDKEANLLADRLMPCAPATGQAAEIKSAWSNADSPDVARAGAYPPRTPILSRISRPPAAGRETRGPSGLAKILISRFPPRPA